MNIPSKILIDATNFAMNESKVKHELAKRDVAKNVNVKSIKSEIFRVIPKRELIAIRIYIDFLTDTAMGDDNEDLIINIVWDDKESSFKLAGVLELAQV